MKNRNSSAATGPIRPGSPIGATGAVATEEPFSDLPVEWFERAGPPLDNCPTSIYTEREEYTAGQLSTEESMKLDAPFIKSVSEHWHNHVVACKGRILEPEDHRYNCYIPHLAIADISHQVVPDYCATIQGIELTTVQGDHSQVIQPIDEQDTRYKVWRNAVQNALTSLHASQKVPVSERYSQPGKNTLLNLNSSPVEQREQATLLACANIERAQLGPQYPSVATLVHALQDQYAVQDLADTLEWLEQQGDIQLFRVFADPERHRHHIEAWSFSLTAQGKRKRALLNNT